MCDKSPSMLHTQAHIKKTTIRQIEKNMGNAFSTATHCRINIITHYGEHLHFRNGPIIATYHQHDEATMLTYNSSTDGHYLSKKDRKQLGLLILRVSSKKVGLTNGGACWGKHVTKLPFPQLSNRVAEADTFE